MDPRLLKIDGMRRISIGRLVAKDVLWVQMTPEDGLWVMEPVRRVIPVQGKIRIPRGSMINEPDDPLEWDYSLLEAKESRDRE